MTIQAFLGRWDAYIGRQAQSLRGLHLLGLDADDVAQEIRLELVRLWERYGHDPDPPLVVSTVGRRRAKFVRALRVRRKYEDELYDPAAHREAVAPSGPGRREDAAAWAAHLLREQMSPRQFGALYLRSEGGTAEELAGTSDKRERRAVLRAVHRAKQRARDLLAGEGILMWEDVAALAAGGMTMGPYDEAPLGALMTVPLTGETAERLADAGVTALVTSEFEGRAMLAVRGVDVAYERPPCYRQGYDPGDALCQGCMEAATCWTGDRRYVGQLQRQEAALPFGVPEAIVRAHLEGLSATDGETKVAPADALPPPPAPPVRRRRALPPLPVVDDLA